MLFVSCNQSHNLVSKIRAALLVVVVVCVACEGAGGSVRHNITLVMPDGTHIPWWPAPAAGPTNLDAGMKINIATKLSVGAKPYPSVKPSVASSSEESAPGTHTATESDEKGVQGSVTIGQGSTRTSATCGKPFVGDAGGDNDSDSSERTDTKVPLVVVWPVSTSQDKSLNVSVIHRGQPNTLSYNIYFRNEEGPISPFHDVPLFANEGNKIFNMVVEVPRWTNAKMEIATKDSLNPIKQDVKKGKLRYVANVFPHHGYIWNYGALPQTWEDPSHIDEATGCKGDNDPIDVCEIGYRVAKRGEVIQVKVLGTVALIDEGETDWKLIAIDVNDPLAPQLSDISDVEKHMPGFLKATVEWFRIYKIPDGKPENQFAFNGKAKDRDFAHKIIMETHEAWQNLIEGKSDAGGLSTTCVSVLQAANKLSLSEATAVMDESAEPGPPQPIDPKVDLWHYVSLK